MTPADDTQKSSDRGQHEDGLFDRINEVMPWAVSILFHVGLLLVLLFIVMIQPKAPPDLLGGSGADVSLGGPGAAPVQRRELPRDTPTQEHKVIAVLGPAPDIADAAKKMSTTNGRVVDVPGDDDKDKKGRKRGPGLGDGLGRIPGVTWIIDDEERPATKIVFVVDSSGSMFENFPYVKAQLKKTIGQLSPIQRFDVVFFADGKPFELEIDGAVELHHATGRNKRAALAWIDSRDAGNRGSGQTDPRPALSRAFAVPGGPPEVVFLLTDGLFPPETVELLDRLNARRVARIHTIAFDSRDGERLLSRIAERNGGKFKFCTAEELAD